MLREALAKAQGRYVSNLSTNTDSSSEEEAAKSHHSHTDVNTGTGCARSSSSRRNSGDGRVQVVLIGGPSGCGKSELVRSTLPRRNNEISATKKEEKDYDDDNRSSLLLVANTKFQQPSPTRNANDNSIDDGPSIGDSTTASTRPFAAICELLSNLIDQFQTTKPNIQKMIRDTLKDKFLQVSPTVCSALCRLLSEEECRMWLPTGAVVRSSSSHSLGIATDETKQDTDTDDECTTNQNNVTVIQFAIQTLFRSITSIATIVLAVDDILWSDDITLGLLKSLVMDSELTNLLIVATYRDNENATFTKNNDDHLPFWTWKRTLEETSRITATLSLQQIPLNNLSLEELKDALSQILHLESDNLEEFVRLLKDRTDGNIFFLKQLLQDLQDVDAIEYDDCNKFQWMIHMEQVRKQTSLADNVGQLVCSRIASHLPTNVQEILKLASCFGAQFDIDVLKTVYSEANVKSSKNSTLQKNDTSNVDNEYKKGKEDSDLVPCLEVACKEQMLIQISERRYKFAHDQIQFAVFSMLRYTKTKMSRSSLREGIEENQGLDGLIYTRWNITKLLLASPNLYKDDRFLFACADQAHYAIDIVQTETDRVFIAKMNLAAGIRAASMSAFFHASKYLGNGVKALGGHNKAFSSHYDLSMQLHSLLAKTSGCMGQHDFAKEIAETALKYAKTFAVTISPLMTIFQCLLADPDVESVRLHDACYRNLLVRVPRLSLFIPISNLQHIISQRSVFALGWSSLVHLEAKRFPVILR